MISTLIFFAASFENRLNAMPGLRQNGRLFFLNAELSRLQATDSRPLSDTRDKLEKLYAERMGIYLATADVTVPELASAQAEADYIMEKREEGIR